MYLRLISLDGKLPCPEEIMEISRILASNGFEVIGDITENSRGGLNVHINIKTTNYSFDRLIEILQEMRYMPGL